MFNNDLFSDVKFVVQKPDDKSESKRRKQVIPAHKFVLSISSPVFEAMFYGELAETTDSIELPDCDYDSLLELFRYMYSDEVILSGSNVMAVLYLAKKYMVPSLADKCTKYLLDNLDPSNVFSILPSAQKYEEKSVVDQCWKMIDIQTEEAVKSEVFATIEWSLLEKVVERDTLTIEEIELFKAVDLWATKACERQGLAVNGPSKRRILKEHVLKEIRFPTMKLEDFAGIVLNSELLTNEEIVSVVKCLGSAASSPVGFPERKRSGFQFDIHQCFRFNSSSSVLCSSGGIHAISFSVDKDIVLHGVCLYGREDSACSVELDVTDSYTKSVCVSKTGEFSSELLQGKRDQQYNGYRVLFNKKIVLKNNTMYSITAKISEPPSVSLRGAHGESSVQCSGVTFSFMDSEYSITGTNVFSGQFPALLFSLYKQ